MDSKLYRKLMRKRSKKKPLIITYQWIDGIWKVIENEVSKSREYFARYRKLNNAKFTEYFRNQRAIMREEERKTNPERRLALDRNENRREFEREMTPEILNAFKRINKYCKYKERYLNGKLVAPTKINPLRVKRKPKDDNT